MEVSEKLADVERSLVTMEKTCDRLRDESTAAQQQYITCDEQRMQLATKVKQLEADLKVLFILLFVNFYCF
jgi:hypothetical protein